MLRYNPSNPLVRIMNTSITAGSSINKGPGGEIKKFITHISNAMSSVYKST